MSKSECVVGVFGFCAISNGIRVFTVPVVRIKHTELCVCMPFASDVITIAKVEGVATERTSFLSWIAPSLSIIKVEVQDASLAKIETFA